jgi:hypothetical protein
MSWAWHKALMGDKRNLLRVLVHKSSGNRLFGIPRHRWEDNVRMYLKDIKWNDMESIYLAENRDKWWAVVNIVTKLWVP